MNKAEQFATELGRLLVKYDATIGVGHGPLAEGIPIL